MKHIPLCYNYVYLVNGYLMFKLWIESVNNRPYLNADCVRNNVDIEDDIIFIFCN